VLPETQQASRWLVGGERGERSAINFEIEYCINVDFVLGVCT
jgi:hypothetical protein